MSSPRSAKQRRFEAALAHGNTKAELPFESCEKPGGGTKSVETSAKAAGEGRGGRGVGVGETLKTGRREKAGPPGSQRGGKHSLTACDFCQTADRLAEDLFVCASVCEYVCVCVWILICFSLPSHHRNAAFSSEAVFSNPEGADLFEVQAFADTASSLLIGLAERALDYHFLFKYTHHPPPLSTPTRTAYF